MKAYLLALICLCRFLTSRQKLMYEKNFKFSILFIHLGKRKEEMLAYLFPGNIKKFPTLPCSVFCFVLLC